MKKDFVVYLEDILDAMEKAELFVAGMTYTQFEIDYKTSYAVIRSIRSLVRLPNDCQ